MGELPHRPSGETWYSLVDLSPDGRWLAYDSDVTGRIEVYITSFPDGGGNWQISHGGGYSPHWSPRGDEVVFNHGGEIHDTSTSAEGAPPTGDEGWLASVHVSFKEGQVAASAQTELFRIPGGVKVTGFHPDGTRLLMIRTLPRQFKGDRGPGDPQLGRSGSGQDRRALKPREPPKPEVRP
jgi:hypothetical protein